VDGRSPPRPPRWPQARAAAGAKGGATVSAAPQALPARPVRRSPWAVARGLAAVAVFIASGVADLLSAVLGTPRASWLARQWAAACAEEYRRRASGAVDAAVVEDGGGQDPTREGAA
jgi:hypothetical protein